MLIINYIIDVISLIFVISFVYLMILWTFFLRSIPQYSFYIFYITFGILFVWMIVITFIGLIKMIRYLHEAISRKIKKV